MTVSKSIRLTDKMSVDLEKIKLHAREEQHEYLSQQLLIEYAIIGLIDDYEKGEVTIDDLTDFKYGNRRLN